MTLGRPLPEAHYLQRPRLLLPLPKEPGYLVVAAAPFGFGKSVLLSQWSETVRPRRRLWVLLYPGDDPRARVAAALNLPANAPWPAVLAELEKEPTLLVLDDLEDLRSVAPLLKTLPALVGVGTRKSPDHPEVLRLKSEGRAVILTAAELAFTPEEAAQLVGDEEKGKELWQKTGGWPVALSLAATSGEVAWPALSAGLLATLPRELLDELFLLAAVRELPKAAAREETERLADLGLLQRVEGGFRLHDALAEALPKGRQKEALLKFRSRLPPLTLARAYERLGLFEELARLLEAPEAEGPQGASPSELLRWDRLAPGPRGPNRRMRRAIALLAAGERERAVAELLALARDPATPPKLALEAYGVAFFELASPGMGEVERALSLIEEARPLERACQDEEFLARYLSNTASVYFYAGELELAESTLKKALALIPKESPFFPILAVNLAEVGFEKRGELFAHKSAHERAVRAVLEGEMPPWYLEGSVWVALARDRHLLGEKESAKSLLSAGKGKVRERLGELLLEAYLYYLEEDKKALAEVAELAGLLEDAETSGYARYLLAELYLKEGKAEEAKRSASGARGFWPQLALAKAQRDPDLLPKAKTRWERRRPGRARRPGRGGRDHRPHRRRRAPPPRPPRAFRPARRPPRARPLLPLKGGPRNGEPGDGEAPPRGDTPLKGAGPRRIRGAGAAWRGAPRGAA